MLVIQTVIYNAVARGMQLTWMDQTFSKDLVSPLMNENRPQLSLH